MSEVQKQDLPTELLESIERVFRGRGCASCNGIGHRGRLPLFEVMPLKIKEIRRVITEGGTEVQVAQVARREGLVTLSQAALQSVNEGVIGLGEGVKIALSD